MAPRVLRRKRKLQRESIKRTRERAIALIWDDRPGSPECVRCGRKRGLQIDHTYGNGKEDRERWGGSGRGVERAIVRGEANPLEYDILCRMCNIRKGNRAPSSMWEGDFYTYTYKGRLS